MKKIEFEPIRNDQIVSVPGYCVWCGSMVRTPDGKCHLFVSMWESKWGFEYGWVTHSQIGYAVSDEPDGKYEFKGIIMSGSGKEDGWDRDSVHNPNVVYHEGKFYLYYSGNYGDGVYRTHGANQRIGVAYASDPMGPWTRFDTPLYETRVGKFDESGTTNPSVCKVADGRFAMIYKAWSKLPPYNGKVSIGIAFAEHPMGPWKREDNPIFDTPGATFAAEGPCVYSQNGKLYCLLKDMKNFYVPDKFRCIIRFESDDGLKWTPCDPFLFHTRELKYAERGTQLVFRLERPFLYIEDNEPKAFFTATLPKCAEAFSCNVHMGIK